MKIKKKRSTNKLHARRLAKKKKAHRRKARASKS